MENFRILTEVSPWFILLCIAGALGYAFLLYRKKSHWNTTINRSLFAIRFIISFLLFYLLTGPLIRMVKNQFEKPTVVIALDNSQSVKLAYDSAQAGNLKKQIRKLAGNLQKEDYEVDIQLLKNSSSPDEIEKIGFDNRTTNLSGMISEIRNNYENRNLAGIVLATDGIYNEGTDPGYDEYNFPVWTIGLGNPVEKKDIWLKSLKYNKISYAGNKFPIVAEIGNSGFSGEAEITLRKGDNVIEKKTANITGKSVSEVQFIVSGEKPGLQHYEVFITPQTGEFTTRNNEAHAYIEIINDKEKILIVALTPHPDIKALRSALEQKENLQVELFIPGINILKEDKYDLVILHQLPDLYNQFAGLENIVRNAGSIFYITGNQSNIERLSSLNPPVDISLRGNQHDVATPALNTKFEKFALDKSDLTTIGEYPPVTVPFGNYSLNGESEIILYQKIGSVQSDNPLLVTGTENGKKTAVLTGEGIWQWRIHEARTTQATKTFDKLFTNLIQYLSAKEDKRKFRLYTSSIEYNETEQVRIFAEVYNDVYEKVYDKKIQLTLTDESGKAKQYSFINSEANSSIEIKGLKPGLYNFSGNVQVDNKTHSATGAFVIKEMVLEAVNLTANHNLLKGISAKSKGEFYTIGQIDQLHNDLIKNKKPSLIHSNEEYQEFINLPWIFFLILLLITVEWGMRKYYGGY
jgi:hypothetical protein